MVFGRVALVALLALAVWCFLLSHFECLSDFNNGYKLHLHRVVRT